MDTPLNDLQIRVLRELCDADGDGEEAEARRRLWTMMFAEYDRLNAADSELRAEITELAEELSSCADDAFDKANTIANLQEES